MAVLEKQPGLKLERTLQGEEKHRFDVWAAPTSALDCRVGGEFVETLSKLNQTVAITREYEHFVLFLSVEEGRLRSDSWCLPQPTGIAVANDGSTMVVCSTGSPNALIWCDGEQRNAWAGANATGDAKFRMRRVTHLPRTAYIHDIVFMGRELVGTVTGHNFVGAFDEAGECRPVWRPAFLDALGDAIFERNLIQLNSMAAGPGIEHSYFTAFATGRDHKSWKLNGGPVGQGVVLSGLTREPLVSGLTCPHSARLAGERLWVCDSGRGTFGYVEDFGHHDHSRARYIEVGRVPGFARGLAVIDDVVLVGLSRVLSDYADYAPGIDPPTSTCGVWMYCAHTGRNLGWIEWPGGDQVYDIQFLGCGEGHVSAL